MSAALRAVGCAGHSRPAGLGELLGWSRHGDRPFATLSADDLAVSTSWLPHFEHGLSLVVVAVVAASDERKAMLDALLVADEETGRTPLAWLRQEAISSKPRSILETVDKLRHLQTMRVADINLDGINPNRRKFLAQLGRTSVAQAVARMSDERRYPILLAVLERVRQEVVDELVEQFDRCLADTYSRAGRHLEELKLAASRATNEKMRLLQGLGRIVLDQRGASSARARPGVRQRSRPPGRSRRRDARTWRNTTTPAMRRGRFRSRRSVTGDQVGNSSVARPFVQRAGGHA